ncbi:MAG: hypothetical protein PCFJNLEI_04160 [Verrucomicrobiae bacterium]|nr:hypothetical protein [Verrucomicrobiae bacterium]
MLFITACCLGVFAAHPAFVSHAGFQMLPIIWLFYAGMSLMILVGIPFVLLQLACLYSFLFTDRSRLHLFFLVLLTEFVRLYLVRACMGRISLPIYFVTLAAVLHVYFGGVLLARWLGRILPSV